MKDQPAPAIAYLYPSRSFFVAKDIDGLRAHGVTVHEHGFGKAGQWSLLLNLIGQFFFLLRMRSRNVGTVLAHFAGHHTVLPVLLGFRTHIIVAGADACSFPRINYGSFRKPLMRWSMVFSMRRAATILPVHASLERFDNTYSDLGPRQQGYAHFIKGFRTRSIAIPYGFDRTLWHGGKGERNDHAALCVATGAAKGNAVHFRKGVDLILEVAEGMPQCRFTIVGVNVDSYGEVPPNVRLLGMVKPEQLSMLLSEHGIYLQPSVMEGFPNALCEAMLNGCIPIVSNVTSMPGIVGSMGVVIEKRDVRTLGSAMEQLTALNDKATGSLRENVIARASQYTLEARIHALTSIIRTGPEQPTRISSPR